jgi:DNA polymerase III subunit delta'
VSSIPKAEAAQAWFAKTFAEGRLAHAYLLVGHRSTTLPFAKTVVKMLMTAADDEHQRAITERWVDSREHPDVFWLEPESKRREILIDPVRDLNKKIATTTYFGGWKAALIIDSDRFNAAAANAFLKTLEEPPARTLLLLLSEHPDEMLATIRSRCHYIALTEGARPHGMEYEERLLEILRAGHPANPLYALKSASELQALLDDARQTAESAAGELDEEAGRAAREVYEARISSKVIETRHAIMQWFIMWQRDVMMCVLGEESDKLHFPREAQHLREQAEGLSYTAARMIVEEADSLARRMERNMPDKTLLNDSLMTQAALAYRARAGKL